MSRKLRELKIEVLMRQEKEITFPEFLLRLRNLLGYTRKVVSTDTGISKSKLLDLEYGHFLLLPKDNIFEALAGYYEISKDYLKKKCQQYCREVQKEKQDGFFDRHPEYKQERKCVSK